MHAYHVPARVAEVEDVVRRSRFVTRAGRATSRKEAVRFVQETRERLPGATHYCWAFNAGEPGSTADVRYRVLVPRHRRADLDAAIAEITGGMGRLADDFG